MVRNLNKSETSLLIPIPTQKVKTPKHLKYLSKMNALKYSHYLSTNFLFLPLVLLLLFVSQQIIYHWKADMTRKILTHFILRFD